MYIDKCKKNIFFDGNEHHVICTGQCVFEKIPYTVILTVKQFYSFVVKKEDIQDISPEIPLVDREFLISGISPIGWKNAYIKYKNNKDVVKEDENYKFYRLSNARKVNWTEYFSYFQDKGIYKLYHFTDKSNLDSIYKYGGLYSWYQCGRKGIKITKPGGDYLSRTLDKKYNLYDYVRLSYVSNHPMMYAIKKRKRIANPVIIEISLNVCTLKYTLFSDMNATRNDHSIGESFQFLDKLNFILFNYDNQFEIDKNKRKYYQAEVLVKGWIPVNNFINIIEKI